MAGNNFVPLVLVGGLVIFGISKCNSDSTVEAVSIPPAPELVNSRPKIDEDELQDRAREALEGRSYQDVEGALGCTYDCSGHDAGFASARENEVEDVSGCGGNSQSFIEGCEAYAQALEEEKEEAREDGDD